MSQEYATTIEGLRVTIRWSPKARRYERGVDHGPGLWVATIHGRGGSTLPGGSGISPYEAEQNTRKLLRGARSANDRTRSRKSRRDDYRAKRGTYGGMCLCPCEGSKHPPTMVTFDPEDPYYSGDRTRRKRRKTSRSCGWGPPLSGISRDRKRRRRR